MKKLMVNQVKVMKMAEYEVYVHIFPNGKKYFGQSLNSVSRWAKGNGYSRQKIVFNAIKKYGWENIEHIIIQRHLTKAEADELERRLISENHATDKRYGYNVLIGGKTVPAHGRTKEQNLKDSLSHMKPVCQFSRQGELINTYRSILDAADSLGVKFKTISGCCNGNKKSAYGYVWRFVGDDFNKYDTALKKGGTKKIPVVAYSLEGEYIGSFDGVVEAGKQLNVNPTLISQICHNQKKSTKGYVFRYLNEGGNADE